MNPCKAHDPKPLAEPPPSPAERFAFLRSKVNLGAIKRSLRPGITAAMILEEGCYAAEKEYDVPGLAVAGAIASEGLWAYQINKERQEHEGSVRQ